MTAPLRRVLSFLSQCQLKVLQKPNMPLIVTTIVANGIFHFMVRNTRTFVVIKQWLGYVAILSDSENITL